MGAQQPVGAAEARAPSKPDDIGVIGEAAAKDEEHGVTGKGAGECSQENVPEGEDILVSEEAAENGGALALGNAAQENRDQAAMLDQAVYDLCHAKIRDMRFIAVSPMVSLMVPPGVPHRRKGYRLPREVLD